MLVPITGVISCTRSSAPIPLPVTANLMGWYDASDASTISYSSGTTVSQWRDKSGRNQHLTGTATMDQSNTLMNAYCINDPNMTYPSDDLYNSAFTAVIAFYWSAGPVYHSQIYASNFGDLNFNAGSGATVYSASSGGTASGSLELYIQPTIGAYATNYNLVSTGVHTTTQAVGLYNTTAELRLDGATVSSTTFGSTGTPISLYARGLQGAQGTYTWTGRVGEMIFYDRKLTSSEMIQLETYLGNKWGLPADPDYADVKLLMHADGEDTSSSFIDSGPANTSIVAYSGAQNSATQYKFGGASAKFNGASSYLTLPDFNGQSVFPAGDFTIEMWVRATTGATQDLIAHRDSTGAVLSFWIFRLNADGTLSYYANNSGTMLISATSVGSIASNTWTHVVTQRVGNDQTIYIDGVLQTLTGVSTNPSWGVWAATIAVDPSIGAADNTGSGNWVNGYIDELRLTGNVARYSSNFTPSSQEFPNY